MHIELVHKYILFPLQQEDPHRRRKLQEKREGSTQALNWNKNRTCRKNKKRGAAQASRPSEQSELKLVCSDFERPEPSSDVRSWCAQDSTGEICKAGVEISGSSPAQREEDSYYQKSEKKCADKFCSDSSSDCGSSSGSVRASRGSWGSWSSSSSDCDRKPVADAQHFLPPGDGGSPQDFPQEASIPLSLSHHICSPTDVSGLSQLTESSCPSLPAVPSGAGEEKGLYPPGGLWSSQPVCLSSSFNCPVENSAPGVSQEPTSIPDSSFIDWSASCEGQFPSVYCPLELNDYNAFPEENMNYTSGFPCPSKVQTDFIGHSAQSTWNTPASTPTAWEHASFVNSPSYLTSTRSLSPMSGLFGSIWAPQSDVYESCCPVSPTTEHSTHMENQVMCKEYYPGFNPFRAYMNLDIWTSTANRNANFPLSRDSSYCGNV